jgi:Na+-driven multidrug efflux pump
MAVINILLDYVLIFGHFGFPKMGIMGAGIASSVAEVFSLLFFIWVTRKNQLLNRYQLFKLVKPDFLIVKKTLSISIFVMMQFILSIGSWFVFFMMVEKMGERSLAVSNIIRSIYIFLMIPGWALGSVTSTLVSSSLGEGKPENVMPIIIKIVKFSLLSILTLVAAVLFFPRVFISVYTNNPVLVEATIPSYFIIMGALSIFSVMSVFFSGVLGTANTKTSFVIEAITLSAYRVGLDG